MISPEIKLQCVSHGREQGRGCRNHSSQYFVVTVRKKEYCGDIWIV